MITALDSNILLDLLIGTTKDAGNADKALNRAASEGELILCTICYAEVAQRFSRQVELDSLLDFLGCALSEIHRPAAYLAGHFFHQYLGRGGKRDRILPDFLVAAHAQLQPDRILTRDKRFFGTAVPNLKAVNPVDFT